LKGDGVFRHEVLMFFFVVIGNQPLFLKVF